MRTTLNLDEDILKAATAKKIYEKITLGEAVSQLARNGLTASLGSPKRKSRKLPQFTLPGQVVITSADVSAAQDDDDD